VPSFTTSSDSNTSDRRLRAILHGQTRRLLFSSIQLHEIRSMPSKRHVHVPVQSRLGIQCEGRRQSVRLSKECARMRRPAFRYGHRLRMRKPSRWCIFATSVRLLQVSSMRPRSISRTQLRGRYSFQHPIERLRPQVQRPRVQ